MRKRIGQRELPASAEAGWLRDQELTRSLPVRADGVVLVKFLKEILLCGWTTPPRPRLQRNLL